MDKELSPGTKLKLLQTKYDTLEKSHNELIDTCDMAIGGLTVLALGTPVQDNELIKLIKSRVSKARKL